MQRVKTAAAVLLAVTLLTAMAFLPWLIASVQERQSAHEVSYANINEVNLNINNNTLWDTLVLLSLGNLDSYEIDPDSGKHTPPEILAIAEEAFRPYQDAKLFTRPDPFADSAIEITPLVAYPSGTPGENCIVWGVFVVENSKFDASSWSLNIIIDDNTGKPIAIEYHDSSYPFAESHQYEVLHTFYDLFFQQLGEPFYAISLEQMPAMEYNPSDYYAHTTFTAGDTASGFIRIYFEASPVGFTTHFING